MPPVKLVVPLPPRTGAANFKLVSSILDVGTYVFPLDGKYNGSGATVSNYCS